MRVQQILALLLLLTLLACSPPISATAEPQNGTADLEDYFQGFDGSFVLYDLNNDRYTRYHPEKCAERLLPASTFKIMNALIGLETGVIPDEDYRITWDGTHYDLPNWNQDHTLKTAFRDSVVWYYQEVARRIGKEEMQHYIDAVGYGNEDITGNLDSFWLDGAIRISADEQVEFLKRLYRGDLPFSQRSIDKVKGMMLLESGASYQLRGKTGSGLMDTFHVGWFVGYAERNSNIYFFALNIMGENPQVRGSKAKEILLDILQDQIMPVDK